MSSGEFHAVPRRCAANEIKLLRLELYPHPKSFVEDIGTHWNHAQPAESLSPSQAAKSLGVEIWAPASVVKKRYQQLQRRYPPEQFMDKHIEWRPSFELLSQPVRRLNWFWQSGFIPYPDSELPANDNLLWDEKSVEPSLTSKFVLNVLS